MLTILLSALVMAGTAVEPAEPGLLQIDARLPAEVLVDGRPLAELYQAARIELEVPAGEHTLKVYTNGNPEEIEISVPAGGSLGVLVGRTGTSIDKNVADSLVAADAPVPIQLRMNDSIGARVTVNRERIHIEPHAQIELELPVGPHQISVRSKDGTVVWASGTLHVDGPDAVVVQLSEGRLPEVSGKGSFASRQ